MYTIKPLKWEQNKPHYWIASCPLLGKFQMYRRLDEQWEGRCYLLSSNDVYGFPLSRCDIELKIEMEQWRTLQLERVLDPVTPNTIGPSIAV